MESVRVSDQQREEAARQLREHFAAGRLTPDELDERLQAAYGARTEPELERLLADLPRRLGGDLPGAHAVAQRLRLAGPGTASGARSVATGAGEPQLCLR